MDIYKIVEGLKVAFPEGPPTEQQVRCQEVKFRAAAWLKRWPDDLPIPVFLEPGAEYRVTRQDLFDMGQKIESPADALAYYVWVAGWGTGTKARSVGRSAKVLTTPDLSELLWKSYSTVNELGAVEAYRQLYSWDHHRIKHFGPAFFTKWIYFSAYDSWENSSPAPLILDKRVAKSLCLSSTGWSSKTYGKYLTAVEEIREIWTPDQGSHIVEFALFKANGLS